MNISSLLVLLLAVTPAYAGGRVEQYQGIYNWCANAAPEYLFDASFDEWMDACLDGWGKKKKKNR